MRVEWNVIAKAPCSTCSRFPTSLPALRHPASQAFQLAVGLAGNLLDAADNSSFAALFALDSNLTGKAGLLDVHDARSKLAHERCAPLLLAHHKNTLDEASDTPTVSSDSPGGSLSSSASGVALRYTRELGLFLLSPAVTGALVIVPSRTSADGSAQYDEQTPGLLALLDTTTSDGNRLRLLFAWRNVFVTQALLSNFHHPGPLFKTLAEARPKLSLETVRQGGMSYRVDFLPTAIFCFWTARDTKQTPKNAAVRVMLRNYACFRSA